VVVIGDCTPDTAEASMTTGACSWTQAGGSLTPVSIELNHAVLTINGKTYATSQTINLAPGSYPYSWTAEVGYIGNGSGTLVIGDCTPGTASASVTIGTCSWTQAAGSLTPVTLDLEHATMKIHGVTYTTSQTINLAPGSYPYKWKAVTGYIGSGSGTLVIDHCAPSTASASVTIGACSWTQAAGSLTPVSIELKHASLTINGVTYVTSQTIDLPPGSYAYSWTAEAGYIGSGSGTLVIGDCPPSTASASVTTGVCSWTQSTGSLTPVSLELKHAALTINGKTYATSQTVNLAPGSYPYSWTAEAGYIGNGSGTLVIGDCAPSTASGSISIGACNWTQAGSLTPVSLILNHASLTINAVNYNASQTINLSPGNYPYSWTAEAGYIGSGSATAVIRDCPPILIPVSGVDRGLLNQNLPGALSGLSFDNYASTNFSALSDILNSIPVVTPMVISDKSYLHAITPESQSTGLIPNRLVISRIKLDVPIVPVGFQETASAGQVYNQWLTPVQYAAGWHVTSALLGVPGNTVLNGHHNAYGMVFKDLVKLQIGDAISVYSGSQEFRYQVVSNMLLPERFEPLSTRIENARWIEPSLDERITLVTCWPQDNNTHRVVIVAMPISNPDLQPSP
jgi:LPXTG-site transpeptidase (sortase) family protein